MILNNSNESIKIAAIINTLFFSFSSLFLFLIPIIIAKAIIINIIVDTKTKCCQDIYPSGFLVYPPKPKNSFIYTP